MFKVTRCAICFSIFLPARFLNAFSSSSAPSASRNAKKKNAAPPTVTRTKEECEAVRDGCGPERKAAVDAAIAQGVLCRLREDDDDPAILVVAVVGRYRPIWPK